VVADQRAIREIRSFSIAKCLLNHLMSQRAPIGASGAMLASVLIRYCC
jgi:hypothetical protein